MCEKVNLHFGILEKLVGMCEKNSRCARNMQKFLKITLDLKKVVDIFYGKKIANFEYVCESILNFHIWKSDIIKVTCAEDNFQELFTIMIDNFSSIVNQFDIDHYISTFRESNWKFDLFGKSFVDWKRQKMTIKFD